MKTKTIIFSLAFSILGLSAPGLAYEYREGYARQCFEMQYREEYVPGTINRTGYVRTYRKRVEVPCNRGGSHYEPRPVPHPSTDNNSCIEGAVIGGLLGGGAGAAASRGEGRWWAIPLGIAGGSLIGCQVDGG